MSVTIEWESCIALSSSDWIGITESHKGVGIVAQSPSALLLTAQVGFLSEFEYQHRSMDLAKVETCVG